MTKYLEHYSSTDLEKFRLIVKELIKSHPQPNQFIQYAITIELSSPSINLSLIRSYYEHLHQLEPQNLQIWIDRLQFELVKGIENCNKIYWRASKYCGGSELEQKYAEVQQSVG